MDEMDDKTPAQLPSGLEQLSRYSSGQTQNVITQFGNVKGKVEQLDHTVGISTHPFVSANCGMALRAYYLKHGGILREQQLAKKSILRFPDNLEAMGSNQPSLAKYYLFSSSEHFKDFYSKVKVYGWRIASSMFKAQCIGNYARDFSKAMEMNKARVYVVKCAYLPKKSFRISKHQMRLSDDAIHEALQVKTLSAAANFLKNYHSHVSQSLYHVGGYCITSMAIEKSQNTESKLASSLLELGAGLDLGEIASALLEIQAPDSASQQSSLAQTGQIEREFLGLGPTAVDEASFCEKLDKDPSSWAIIDKEEHQLSDLVGVWEIMLQEENKSLEEAAKLVCNSWQSQIVGQTDLSVLLEESKKFFPTDVLTRLQPCDTVTPAHLPAELEKLKMNQEEDNERELTLSVTQLLKSCLATYPSKGVVSVITEFGFDSEGNKVDGHWIEGGQLDVMIQELGKAMQDNPGKNIENVTVETCWPQSSSQKKIGGVKECEVIYHYMGDIVVDRPLTGKDDPCRRLLDRLRHRVEPFQSCLDDLEPSFKEEEDDPFQSCLDNLEPSSEGKEDDDATMMVCESSVVNFDSPLKVLADTIEKSDLVTQIAICEFLLEQRSSYPIILKTGNTEVPFKCYAQVLEFVEVKVQMEQLISMAEDQRLPRVVFLSDCSSKIAPLVTHCDFVSGYDTSDSVTGIAEIGMGFIGPINCLAINIRFSDSLPGILRHFAEEIADVVVMMQEEGEIDAFNNLIVYRCKQSRKSSKKGRTINGPDEFIKRELKLCLSKDMQHEHKTYRRKTLKEICISLFGQQSWVMYPEIQNTCNEIDFSRIHEQLQLQKSYMVEASLEFQLLSFKNDKAKAQANKIKIQEERSRRHKLAETVAALPIIRLFHSMLSEDDAVCRVIGIMSFQKQLCHKLVMCNAAKYGKPQAATMARHLNANQDQDHVDKCLDLNYLWRELCHIFVADPKNQRHLCELAAQHLVDGFPMEILDGDSGNFCQAWVETILVELEQKLIGELGRTPKISVLTVIGQQSSGKSTLLNRMFGTKLQTSAGRCTRGIYLQLVKSERGEYDYVFLLDTEGLRSPEHFGREDGGVRDNRMVTFAVLPSDACLCLSCNEDDSALKESLPLIMMVFKGSAIYESAGWKVRPKMFYIYRSVDRNDVSKLEVNKRRLKSYLTDAIGKISKAFHDGAKAFLGSVHNSFEVNDSVRFLGNIKRGSTPPEDVPDWDYGVQVLNLSEDVHNQIAKTSKFEGIKEWSAYLGGVMECILSSNFELTFKNTADYQAYNIFQEKLNTEYKKLSKIYFNAFQRIESNIMSLKSDTRTPNFESFKHQVLVEKFSVDGSIDEILKDKDSQKWGTITERVRWKDFCSNLNRTYETMLKDLEGVLKFPVVVSQYEERVKNEVIQRIDEFKRNKDEGFEELFSSILQEARRNYKPIADDVPNKVAGIYTEHPRNVSSFTSTGTTRHAHQRLNPTKLKNMVDVMLQNETQFSEHIVFEVMEQTTKYMEDEYNSKADRAKGQNIVKESLQNKLKKIQERWDNEHNVAKRLERSRPRLETFFNSLVNGLSLAVALKSELETFFMENLDVAFNHILANRIIEEYEKEKWGETDSRACVDLHLLLLAEEGKIDELLCLVKNMPKNYKIVTRAIISSMLVPVFQRHWKSYVEKVANCVVNAGVKRAKTAVRYVDQLVDALRKCGASKLAFSLSSVNVQHYEGELLEEFYSSHIPELKKSLLCKEQDTKNRESLEELVPDLMRRLSLMGNTNILARCAEQCPLCTCPCWKSGSHDLHDTVHQPRGLIGATSATGRVIQDSCTSKFRYGFWYEHLWFPKTFTKAFGNWQSPRESSALKVREYIFYNYEERLSEKYTKGTRCNLSQDSRYNHHIGTLHNELRNVLGTKYDAICAILNNIDTCQMMEDDDDQEEDERSSNNNEEDFDNWSNNEQDEATSSIFLDSNDSIFLI